MFRTDDPIADFHRYSAKQEEKLKRLPRCDDCKNRIDEDFFKIDDEILCGDCIHDRYGVTLEDYLDSLED